MDIYSKALKRRIVKTRLVGILSAILATLCVFFYYFNVLDHWVCIIMLSYSMAISFTLNSSYQDINGALHWSKFSLLFAVVFFVATLALIIYAFASGNIRF